MATLRMRNDVSFEILKNSRSLLLSSCLWKLVSGDMGKKQFRGRPGRSRKRIFRGNQFQTQAKADETVNPDPEPDAEIDTEEGNFQNIASESSSDESDSEEESLVEEDSADEAQSTGNRLIDLQCLQKLLGDSVCCKICHEPITLSEQKRDGMTSILSVSCKSVKQ